MAVTTTGAIKRALVRQLRADVGIGAAIVGGIHEGLAPRKVKYPFITYSAVTAPYDYDWSGHLEIRSMWDIFAWAENPVEAHNLDSLIANALNEAPLSVDGQTVLYCRRVAEPPTGPDTDADGRRIYQVGGTYMIWTDQAL